MSDILEEFLNAFWLRPETALWRTVDVLTMSNAKMVGRSLDFGCGDGVYSFIRAGGTFCESFDVFQGADNLDAFFKNVDVYDHSITGHIATKDNADYAISIGFDHKQALLDKAAKLNFYDELILGDGNKKLPFEDNEFDSIFSNIIYWLDDLQSVLTDLNRVLKPGGSIYIMLPDSNLLESSFFYNYQVKNSIRGFEFLNFLDRGRFASNYNQVLNESQWKEEISKAGLKVAEHKTHLSIRLLSIWDVGFRPIFPALTRASNRMSLEHRLQFKKDLIEHIKVFAVPLFELEQLDLDSNKGFHFFHLTK
jgi:SAM-dependent methyltransferase